MNSRQAEVLAQLRGASKHYARQMALDGVDLRLCAGELTALIGPNGAGKSTAIGLLLGLMKVDSGSARLFGRPPGELGARRQIGVMLQSAGVPDACKVGELLELTRSYYPAPRSADECVALAGLDGLLNRRYGTLSGGQQRRVQFALALCGRPRVLFLDEPTTGLDLESRQRLWKAIRDLVGQGCSVLLTTHYLEEAEALADRVVVLKHGRVIAAGSVQEVRARVTQRHIRCVTTVTPEVMGAWPEVRCASINAGRLELTVDGAESVLRRLLAEDPHLSELEVHRAGLADAFLELTREAA